MQGVADGRHQGRNAARVSVDMTVVAVCLAVGEQIFHVVVKPIELSQVAANVQQTAMAMDDGMDMPRQPSHLACVVHFMMKVKRVVIMEGEFTSQGTRLLLQPKGQFVDMVQRSCLGRTTSEQGAEQARCEK